MGKDLMTVEFIYKDIDNVVRFLKSEEVVSYEATEEAYTIVLDGGEVFEVPIERVVILKAFDSDKVFIEVLTPTKLKI